MIGEVIDGQHRLAGLKSSDYLHAFQLPVVFMFNLEDSQKAYVFSVINSKQTRVNMSLIYDLFALSKNRSPYKTCHEVARSMNKDPNSPFYRRLKMLGKKEIGDELASISQGSFIKFTLELISVDPEKDTRLLKDNNTKLTDNNRCPLRKYFIAERDDVILKILFNMFSALSRVFRNEWNEPNKYILSKSIGFGAVIKAFPKMYEIGFSKGDLSVDFFEEQFSKVRDNFKSEGKEFTSHCYGSNEQARTKLANDITKGLD